MKPHFAAVLAAGLLSLLSMPGMTHAASTTIAEKTVTELPAGPLFWRLDNFGTAEAAAGPTGLVAEADGKVWLVTLGPSGEASAGGTTVAQIGPLPPVTATEYLLRVREATNPPGHKSTVHSHPGPRAYYMLDGELTQKSPDGVTTFTAAQSTPGHSADTPIQVSNNGSTDQHMLVLFVVDASKPFSSPAEF